MECQVRGHRITFALQGQFSADPLTPASNFTIESSASMVRSAGELRPDVLMYLTGALERVARMSRDQILTAGLLFCPEA